MEIEQFAGRSTARIQTSFSWLEVPCLYNFANNFADNIAYRIDNVCWSRSALPPLTKSKRRRYYSSMLIPALYEKAQAPE